MTARALALAVSAGSVRTMAHPTSANTTVVGREGFLIEGVPGGVSDSGTQI